MSIALITPILRDAFLFGKGAKLHASDRFGSICRIQGIVVAEDASLSNILSFRHLQVDGPAAPHDEERARTTWNVLGWRYVNNSSDGA